MPLREGERERGGVEAGWAGEEFVFFSAKLKVTSPRWAVK